MACYAISGYIHIIKQKASKNRITIDNYMVYCNIIANDP